MLVWYGCGLLLDADAVEKQLLGRLLLCLSLPRVPPPAARLPDFANRGQPLGMPWPRVLSLTSVRPFSDWECKPAPTKARGHNGCRKRHATSHQIGPCQRQCLWRAVRECNAGYGPRQSHLLIARAAPLPGHRPALSQCDFSSEEVACPSLACCGLRNQVRETPNSPSPTTTYEDSVLLAAFASCLIDVGACRTTR